MTQRKKLIEVALPLEAINVASAREKSIRHGHPSTLHLWWARRPLAAARAVIFTSLVDDPDSELAPKAFVEACKQLDGNQFNYENKYSAETDTPRMRLFDFIAHLVTWESTADEKMLEKARELILLSTDGNPPPLLDPFAGGGSIPLEAQRLGLEAHASDLNPVAVMINKAQIEIPPRFADMPPVNPRDRENNTGGNATWKGASGLAADVRYYGEWMREKAFEKIGHLYPKINDETVIAWIWARTAKCPNPACGADMPLITTFALGKKKGRKAWIVPLIDKANKTIKYEIHQGSGTIPDAPKAGRGAKFNCLVCGNMPHEQYLKDEGVAHRLGHQLIGIVTEGDNRRNYHAPSQKHTQFAFDAHPEWKPIGELPEDPRNVWCKLYGLIDFSDLFTSRQLLTLTTFSDLVETAREKTYSDAVQARLQDDNIPLRENGVGARAYAEAVSVYLGFLVDQLSNMQSTICGWNTPNEQLKNTFTRQSLPMTWDYAESNPFCNSSGSYNNMHERMVKGLAGLAPAMSGYAYQQDATHITLNSHAMISTDPPYYDNIGYANLSDYFYVWLRNSLKSVYPEIFSTMQVPKDAELIANPYRHGGRASAEKHFEMGLQSSFTHMRQIVEDKYPLTVYYAFRQSEIVSEGASSTGWETMLSGLVNSGYSIDGTWPMRTERNTGVKAGINALASSIVLVCRPRPEDAPQISRREFVSLLRQELPPALIEMQSGNIAPVDLAQASIGPGMAAYSRYSQVLEADGTPLTVRTALQIINQELDAYLSETEGHIDADSRFAVAWFEQNSFAEGDFGQADVLARAKNTSVAGIEEAHIIESGRGKVRLLSVHDLYEMNPDWNPADDKRATTWEAVHHLIARLQRYGESGAALLMLKMDSEMAAEARQLAYRLYSICERKGWADHARDYNAIVVQWSDIQSEVAGQREALARGDSTRQTGLPGFGE